MAISEIASKNNSPRPIGEVAAELEIGASYVIPYGELKAKIRLDARSRTWLDNPAFG